MKARITYGKNVTDVSRRELIRAVQFASDDSTDLSFAEPAGAWVEALGLKHLDAAVFVAKALDLLVATQANSICFKWGDDNLLLERINH